MCAHEKVNPGDSTRSRSPEGKRGLWLIIPVAAFLVLAAVVMFLTWPREDPDAVWRHAQEALQQRSLSGAERDLATLTRLRSPTPEDWMLRAQLAMARDQYEAAQRALAMIGDGEQLAPQARLLAGQLALRHNLMRKAEQYLLKAVELNPKLVQAHRELIYIYGMQLRREELDQQFHELSRLSRPTFENMLVWCLPRGRIWDPDELIGDLKSYLDADPQDRCSRLSLAATYAQLGDFAMAEKTLEPLPPADADAQALRASVALEEGKPGKAARLLEDGPENHAEQAKLRGRLALQRHDAKEALRHYEIAERLEPGNRDVEFGLGQALRLLGRKEEADRHLELARNQERLGSLMQEAANTESRVAPDLPLRLGFACIAVGRLDEARGWFQVAIARNPLDREAQKALYELDQQTDQQKAVSAR